MSLAGLMSFINTFSFYNAYNGAQDIKSFIILLSENDTEIS